MNFADAAPLRGELALRVFRGGREIENYREKNMIVAQAREALAHLLGGDGAGRTVAAIGVGVNGDGPGPDDSALTDAFVKPLSGVSYPASGQVVFAFSIGADEANDKSIREFGLLCADGALFARKTRGAIEKAGDIEITGTWTITF